MDEQINKFVLATQKPPVMEVRDWVKLHDNSETPLLNLSQAAPMSPPPDSLLKFLSEQALLTENHLYGDVLGDIPLREEIVNVWNEEYSSSICINNVAITSGCNQAFCAAISTIASAGDSILLPVPWYFNHEMWLTLQGIKIIPLPCDINMNPDIGIAKRLIDKKTKAIVMVTPNNPTGIEYPSDLIKKFSNLARDNNIKLIIDETYKNFGNKQSNILYKGKWSDHLIQLYSFSKVFRLTGHRVGLMVASKSFMKQVEKFLDTTTICPNRLAQKAAYFGLLNLQEFMKEEKLKIKKLKDTFEKELSFLPNWTLLGIGGYFAYLGYNSTLGSISVAKKLLADQNILTIPGDMFFPKSKNLFIKERRSIRIAFANSTNEEIIELFKRLKNFSF
ncbi:aminotransferase [Paracoccaceae bacterium]|nr:aminotransferase [Paracoccaceae bacterium]